MPICRWAPYVFAVPVDSKTETAPILARLGIPLLHGAQGAGHDRVGNLLLIGGSRAIERLKNIKPTARPDLAAACDAVAGSTAQILLVPPAEVRRIIEEMMPNLPAQLGGGTSRILTQGALWGAVGFDLSPQKVAARAVVQSADPSAAAALNAELSKILQAVGQTSEMQKLVPKFAEFAQAIKPAVSGDRLTLELNEANGGLSDLASLVSATGRGGAGRGQPLSIDEQPKADHVGHAQLLRRQQVLSCPGQLFCRGQAAVELAGAVAAIPGRSRRQCAL